MRWVIAGVMLVHGMIHFLGVAKSFGLAEVAELTEPVSPRLGVLWLGAGLAMLLASALWLTAPRVWWIAGLVAVALSQTAVLSAWSDARFGTIANVVVLGLAVWGLAAHGPWSLRAEYENAVRERLAGLAATTIGSQMTTTADLADLPQAIQAYAGRTGAVGAPRPTHFRAEWRGRIRSGPDDPWMDFTAEQYNFADPPERFFMMAARRGGLPVDVLHVFDGDGASMRVRLLSLFPLVDATGPELTRAETVTILNDWSILAPAALPTMGVRWGADPEGRVRAELTIGENTVGARLEIENGELIDFVSDDRLVASSDGTRFTRQRWSTPLSDYRAFGPWRVAGHGEGWWHPPDAEAYGYLELELLDLQVNPTR